jgi:hypothetical protein
LTAILPQLAWRVGEVHQGLEKGVELGLVLFEMPVELKGLGAVGLEGLVPEHSVNEVFYELCVFDVSVVALTIGGIMLENDKLLGEEAAAE